MTNPDEIRQLLEILPLHIKKAVEKHPDLSNLIEVILDLGKQPEVRFLDHHLLYIEGPQVTEDDIEYVTSKVGEFTSDNRSGIERTLHRISGIRNRRGKIIGLTCRVGRAIFGTIDVVRDVVQSGKNILFMGPPGIGKTTKLRESARVISDELNKRVIVIDTSNEIAGDGDIPHPGIGRARRMQVASPDRQHQVMIEAVENHMPEVIIIDEIGTEAEAGAARTIAERGVQLVGTAHGNNLENIVSNPTLSDLVGGVQSVILGDEEAKRRRTQKTILERKALPTFDIVVEIREKDTFAIYWDVAKTVDMILRGRVPVPEIRVRKEGGKVEIKKAQEEIPLPTKEETPKIIAQKKDQPVVRIYLFGVNRGSLERGLRSLRLPAVVVTNLDDADLILTVKSKARAGTKIMNAAEAANIPVHVIKKNISSQILKFLKFYFRVGGREVSDEAALEEAREAAEEVRKSRKSLDLSPQNSYLRRVQHQIIQDAGLRSESVGEEPKRRLRVYPPA